MRVAHILRKYNPAEWGGTETAVQGLLENLARLGIEPVLYCPKIPETGAPDPIGERYSLKRFRAHVPMFGTSRRQREHMIAIGGNLMSFDLGYLLWKEQGLAVIHSHALGRIGAIGRTVARMRRLPFVVTIHGGALDLPPDLKQSYYKAPILGWEWGKVFGAVLRARTLLADADAILTCNPHEASLLQKNYPGQRIQVQPHGVVTSQFQVDHRADARKAWPQFCGKQLLLSVCRIDYVKNQGWLVEQMPAILSSHPNAILVLTGACTNQAYGEHVRERIRELGLAGKIILTGGLAPGDPKLIGLYQEAAAVLLPSLAETFGLVILEAWAAGKTVLSSRTSGAASLINHGQTGWLFDLAEPLSFHRVLQETLQKPELAGALGAAGRALAAAEYDTQVLAGRVKNLYLELLEEKNALRRAA